MTKRSRRNHSASFKAKVMLTALRGGKALVKIAQQCEVHPNQVKEWKWQLPERANVFDGAFAGARGENEPEIKTLHAKIGQLTLENDFSSDALTKVGLLSARK